MKIITIIGTRPQFIKSAIVSKMLRSENISETVIHTGQHYDNDMSDIFFNDFKLTEPDYFLDIRSEFHGDQTGKMLMEIEKILMGKKYDLVLVYGDSNTTLAGGLAAAKLRIPIAHVEAGLRSYNNKMPEEINRIIIDHLSKILFAPTDFAVTNLSNEGITEDVYNVGDVMYDVAIQLKNIFSNEGKNILSNYGLVAKNYILTTIHRVENTCNKANLENIWNALLEIANKGIKIFFPVHPRTKKYLNLFNILQKSFPQNMILNEPISYREMIVLENNASLIITDSGGVQKEGYFFKVPCVIPRSETEWNELVDIGWNTLVRKDKEQIISCVFDILNKDFSNKNWLNFYGNGMASEKIVEILDNKFKKKRN